MTLVMLLSFLMDININASWFLGSSKIPYRTSFCKDHETASHHSDPARVSIESEASEEIEAASHKKKSEFGNASQTIVMRPVKMPRPVWSQGDEITILSCPIACLASSIHSQAPPFV
jgi:hypothetical protein